MREHFKDLMEWLRHREDFYYYIVDSGEYVFDRDAFEYEITTYALEFEKRLN